jgi:hypothetical protein
MRKYSASIIHSHPARQRVVVWRFALSVCGVWFSVVEFRHSCFCSEVLLIRLDYCLFSLVFDDLGVWKTRFFRGVIGLKQGSERLKPVKQAKCPGGSTILHYKIDSIDVQKSKNPKTRMSFCDFRVTFVPLLRSAVRSRPPT